MAEFLLNSDSVVLSLVELVVSGGVDVDTKCLKCILRRLVTVNRRLKLRSTKLVTTADNDGVVCAIGILCGEHTSGERIYLRDAAVEVVETDQVDLSLAFGGLDDLTVSTGFGVCRSGECGECKRRTREGCGESLHRFCEVNHMNSLQV